tara:strand:- start:13 stop:513 length:501 start_codon:yes stop_codon:yes gene_type:complete
MSSRPKFNFTAVSSTVVNNIPCRRHSASYLEFSCGGSGSNANPTVAIDPHTLNTAIRSCSSGLRRPRPLAAAIWKHNTDLICNSSAALIECVNKGVFCHRPRRICALDLHPVKVPTRTCNPRHHPITIHAKRVRWATRPNADVADCVDPHTFRSSSGKRNRPARST